MVNNVNVKREQFKYIKVFCLFLNCVLAVALTVSATATLAQSTTNRTTYYHNTMQGTPVAATDENGDVKWSQTYSSYGFHSGNSQDIEENSLVFGTAGHVEDQFEDRLLVYQKARYDDPALGRFLSMDPVGFHASNPQSFNRYAYVNNNPTTFVDPDGRLGIPINLLRKDLHPEDALQISAMCLASLKVGLGASGLAASMVTPGPEDLVMGVGIFGGLKALKAADKVTNKVDDVIEETLGSNKRNLTSQHTLAADEALDAGEKFLGTGYKEIGKTNSGVFRSADGTRQFRIDKGLLTGSHAPNVPHVHLETFKPGANKPTVNNHIPFVD